MTVLIAGAGPTGLVLALTLVKCGILVRIINKEPDHHDAQRGPGFHPRSQEVYHFLGVWPDVQAIAQPILPKAYYALPEGKEIVKTVRSLVPRERNPTVPFERPGIIGQNVNERILRSHLAKHGCYVELNSTPGSLGWNRPRTWWQLRYPEKLTMKK